MNAERLHALVDAVHTELSELAQSGRIDQLATSLRQMVNQPNQPSHQETVSSTCQSLVDELREAPSNQFSPAWRQDLEELGLARLLGAQLADSIESAFVGNELTPVTSAEAVERLSVDVASMEGTLES